MRLHPGFEKIRDGAEIESKGLQVDLDPGRSKGQGNILLSKEKGGAGNPRPPFEAGKGFKPCRDRVT
jgi:hypothetical protein